MHRIVVITLAVLAAAATGTLASAQNPIDGGGAPPRTFERSDRHRTAAGDRVERREAAESRYGVWRVPPGTEIPVRLDEDIEVTRTNIGRRFEGHISRDVEVDGEVVLVRGAPVEVKLVESAERAGAATLRLDRVHLNGDMRRVEADEARADTEQRGLGTLEKTAVGAGAGAVVGAVTGAGVLEGALVGAGGGLAWALLDGDRIREVEDDTALKFRLEEELEN